MNQATLLTMVPVLALLGAACAAEPPSSPHGRAAFALQTATGSGAVYRLEDAEFLVRGPETVTLATDDFDAESLVISTPLAEGNYTVTLRAGWRLTVRTEEGSYLDVQEVELTTPNPVAFTVARGNATPVTFGFRTPGEAVEMTPGGLDLDIAVNEGPVAPRLVSELASPSLTTITHASSAGLWVVGTAGARLVRFDGTEVFNRTFDGPVSAVSFDPTGRVGVAAFSGTNATYQVYNHLGNVVSTGNLSLPANTFGLAFAVGPGSAAALVGENPSLGARIIRGLTSGGTPFEVRIPLATPGYTLPRSNGHLARFDAAGRLWTCGAAERVSPVAHVSADGRGYGWINADLPYVPSPSSSRAGRVLLEADSVGGAYLAVTGELPTGGGIHVLARFETWASEPTFVRVLSPAGAPQIGERLEGAPLQLATGNGAEAVLHLGGPTTRKISIFRPSGVLATELDFSWSEASPSGLGVYNSNVWTVVRSGTTSTLRRYAF